MFKSTADPGHGLKKPVSRMMPQRLRGQEEVAFRECEALVRKKDH